MKQRAKRTIVVALVATLSATLPLLLLPSSASADHNGSWDPTAGKNCWWRLPGAQQGTRPGPNDPPDPPVSDSSLAKQEHKIMEYVNKERRDAGLGTVVRASPTPIPTPRDPTGTGFTSCVSSIAQAYSGNMIAHARVWDARSGQPYPLRQHVLDGKDWRDRLKDPWYGLQITNSNEILSCGTAFEWVGSPPRLDPAASFYRVGIPQTTGQWSTTDEQKSFAWQAMYGPDGWKTKRNSTSHYSIILGGYPQSSFPNWSYAGVGVAAGYVAIDPTIPPSERPPSGITKLAALCATVNFVVAGQIRPAPDSSRSTSSGQRTMYTVVPGDTLSGIAQRFRMAGGWQALYQRNQDRIADPNLIFPGQVLVIR